MPCPYPHEASRAGTDLARLVRPEGWDDDNWAIITDDVNVDRYSFIAGQVTGRTLECGCAHGYLSCLIARRVPALVATDIGGLDNAKRLADVNGVRNIVHLNADARHLPFDDGYFDTVVCSETLEHIVEWRPALAELLRVASRRVVISVPVKGGIRIPDHVNDFDRSDVETSLLIFGDVRYRRLHPFQTFVAERFPTWWSN